MSAQDVYDAHPRAQAASWYDDQRVKIQVLSERSPQRQARGHNQPQLVAGTMIRWLD